MNGAATKGTHPIRASESQCPNKFDDLRLELESTSITLLLSVPRLNKVPKFTRGLKKEREK
jgi:hypothetical protein